MTVVCPHASPPDAAATDTIEAKTIARQTGDPSMLKAGHSIDGTDTFRYSESDPLCNPSIDRPPPAPRGIRLMLLFPGPLQDQVDKHRPLLGGQFREESYCDR